MRIPHGFNSLIESSQTTTPKIAKSTVYGYPIQSEPTKLQYTKPDPDIFNMPVYMVDHPADIFPAIHSAKRPTIAHYWPPQMGKESPATVFLHQVDEYLSGVMDFVIIESGVCPPKHDREEMPLTVLYVNWEEKGSAPYEVEKMQELTENAFPYLE